MNQHFILFRLHDRPTPAGAPSTGAYQYPSQGRTRKPDYPSYGNFHRRKGVSAGSNLMQILYFILLFSYLTLYPAHVSSDAYVISDPTPIIQIENNMIYILDNKEFK